MGSNRTPIDKSMTKQKAIAQGGYYNTDGDWNNITILDEYPGKILRGRVETLVLKDGKLFMLLTGDTHYKIPGGGFDREVLNKYQAFIETKEEAKIIIENIRFSGVTYTHIYDEIWSHSPDEIPYDGTYNEVYVATYKGEYEGYIRKGLSDKNMTNNGDFYDLDMVKHILREPHKQALENVFSNVVTESTQNDLDLLSILEQTQRTLDNLHKLDQYKCINNTNIEIKENEIIFAEYNTHTSSDIEDVKRFVTHCNNVIKNNNYVYKVEEPAIYDNGVLSIKNDTDQESYIVGESVIDLNAKEFFTEAAKENKYPIFIINSYTGGLFGTAIKIYQQSNYAHSSISLDTSLENLYSFNMHGFVREKLSEFIKLKDDAVIQVKCLFVTKRDIDKIQERLDYMWSNRDKSKYNLANIINIMINKAEETKDEMSMVCSQFVSWMLSIADVKLIDKSLNLITPKDFATIEHPKLYLVYEGKAKDYDKKKIDRIFRKLKQKAELAK